MVEGLLSAAEMAEFAANAKLREADAHARQDHVGRAVELRLQAQTLRELAMSYRQRASEEVTGLYVPIDGDPGPGWKKMSRRDTVEVKPVGRWLRKLRKIWPWRWPPWKIFS